jgi:hypothetical protein
MSISKRRLWLDRFQSIKRYYSSPKFALLDMTFGLIALFSNPYRTCRKYLQRRGENDVYVYGETPYATYQRIVEQCGISPRDIWVDMGSGRGKGCFWLAHFLKCKVIGVERIPAFIRIAQILKYLFRAKNLQFKQCEIEKMELSEATVIYLYGLWPHLKIRSGVKVITISEPLEGYQVLKSFWVRFPWGRTTAYLQENRI